MTGDAVRCQGETARLVKDRGGDWLFTLKADRPVQHAEVRAWFADPASRADDEHTTTDADNGRIEVRRHAVIHDMSWMLSDRRHADEAPVPGLATLGMVESSVTRDGKTSTERRFYLSSAARRHGLRSRGPRALGRDVGLDEDRARNRKDQGPENLAISRKLALNVLRKARSDTSIRRKRKRLGWSDEFARSVLGQMR